MAVLYAASTLLVAEGSQAGLAASLTSRLLSARAALHVSMTVSFWLCASGSQGSMKPERMDLKNQSDSRWTPRSQPEARAALTVVFPEPGGPDTITTSPPLITPAMVGRRW